MQPIKEISISNVENGVIINIQMEFDRTLEGPQTDLHKTVVLENVSMEQIIEKLNKRPRTKKSKLTDILNMRPSEALFVEDRLRGMGIM